MAQKTNIFGEVETVTAAYLGANLSHVGGYSTKSATVTGSADFVPWEEVLTVARENGLKTVCLSGDWRAFLSRSLLPSLGARFEGWGQQASIEDADAIVKAVVAIETGVMGGRA